MATRVKREVQIITKLEDDWVAHAAIQYKALTDEIAGEAVERNHEGKMHNPADEDDLENVTDKKIEGEAPGDSTGIKGRPGDNLEQIPTKPAHYAHSRSLAG